MSEQKETVSRSKKLQICGICLSIAVCIIGLGFGTYCIYLLWQFQDTGPNNKALILRWLAFLGGILLFVQLPVLFALAILRRYLGSYLKLIWVSLIILGLIPTLTCVAVYIIKFIQYNC